MGIEAVGTGLKAVLSISGLHVYAPNELPDTPTIPAAIILPGETIYDATFDNSYDFKVRLILLLAKQDMPSAAGRILDYIEPTGDLSVLAKLKADKTLNSTCDSSQVIRNLGVGSTVWGGITYLSTEFEIAIWI